MLAGARAFLATCVAPRFERALRDRLSFTTEACLVAEEPERGEVGVPSLREDALEIGLNPRWAREARVVAHDAQARTIARDAPERAFLRVQVLLREAESTTTTSAVAEGRRQRVEPAVGGSDDHGNAPAQRRVADRVGTFLEDRGLDGLECREAERVSQQREHEALGCGLGVGVRLAARLEVGPVRLRDAPVTTDLVAEVEPLVDMVVGFGLHARPKLGDLRQPLGRQEAAFDRERFEGELGLASLCLPLACHAQSTLGSKTKSPITSAGSSAFTL